MWTWPKGRGAGGGAALGRGGWKETTWLENRCKSVKGGFLGGLVFWDF